RCSPGERPFRTTVTKQGRVGGAPKSKSKLKTNRAGPGGPATIDGLVSRQQVARYPIPRRTFLRYVDPHAECAEGPATGGQKPRARCPVADAAGTKANRCPTPNGPRPTPIPNRPWPATAEIRKPAECGAPRPG